MENFKTFRSAILAGFCIGLAGFGNLAIGGLAGSVVFCFGLLAVVGYGLKLYTGTAGFIQKPSELGFLGIVLLGNLVGCLLVALMARLSPMPIQAAAQKILQARLDCGFLKCAGLSIGCGFIMTTAVTFARKNFYLPLLFGVPLFIICGFPHCIADAFYYMAVPVSFLAENAGQVIVLYIGLVLGNFVGCNLYRLISWTK